MSTRPGRRRTDRRRSSARAECRRRRRCRLPPSVPTRSAASAAVSTATASSYSAGCSNTMRAVSLIPGVAGPGRQLHRQDAVPAEGEEVVVAPDLGGSDTSRTSPSILASARSVSVAGASLGLRTIGPDRRSHLVLHALDQLQHARVHSTAPGHRSGAAANPVPHHGGKVVRRKGIGHEPDRRKLGTVPLARQQSGRRSTHRRRRRPAPAAVPRRARTTARPLQPAMRATLIGGADLDVAQPLTRDRSANAPSTRCSQPTIRWAVWRGVQLRTVDDMAPIPVLRRRRSSATDRHARHRRSAPAR